jgi:hypothetical protein
MFMPILIAREEDLKEAKVRKRGQADSCHIKSLKDTLTMDMIAPCKENSILEKEPILSVTHCFLHVYRTVLLYKLLN